VILITKYNPLDTLRRFRRALLVYFGVLMTRRTRPRALWGGSAADLPYGHECELHFCSLDGFGVLPCGGRSGQGQVVKQESIRGHSTMSYLARSTLTRCEYQFWVVPARGMALLNSLSTWRGFKALSGAAMALLVSA